MAKLRTFSQLADDDQVAHDILHAFIQFLLSLLRPDAIKSERSFFLSDNDLHKILQYKRAANDKENKAAVSHPLLTVQQNLMRIQSDAKPELTDDVKGQISDLAFNVNKLIERLDASNTILLNANKDALHIDSPATEPAYPPCENIVAQYSMRTIYTLAPVDFKAAEYPEQLTIPYWSTNRLDEFEGQLVTESVASDFLEIVKAYLPADTNLTIDCKRLLHLSASPQSNRERTSTVSSRHLHWPRIEVVKSSIFIVRHKKKSCFFCCVCRFHSEHVASKYRARHDLKRKCTLAVAVAFLVLFNHAVIYSDLGHLIHRVHHRCTSTISWHLKHAVLSRLDQRAITSCREILSAYAVHGVEVEDEYFPQTVDHI